MKRYFYSVVATVLLLGISVSPVSALTFEEMQIQVKTLMARIATLTAQMDALKSQEGGAGTMSATSVGTVSSPRHPHRVCALLSRNLNQGSQGDDVRGVQEFLFEQNYLTSSPTGYFGSLTAQAVKKWQANEGITAAGSFGPLSRERMKIWCGGSSGNAERFSGFPTRGEAPLTVVFDSWLSGFRPLSIYYVIDFGDGTSERAADCSAPADACVSPGQNKHTYADRGNYTATLSKVTNPCAGVEVLCKAAIRSEIVATQNITVGPIACTKEYKPVCGAKQVVCIKAPCNPIQQTYGNRHYDA
jgi:peptidoglycan hydrolase-like protein with peptidoglycan-binding domain